MRELRFTRPTVANPPGLPPPHPPLLRKSSTIGREKERREQRSMNTICNLRALPLSPSPPSSSRNSHRSIHFRAIRHEGGTDRLLDPEENSTRKVTTKKRITADTSGLGRSCPETIAREMSSSTRANREPKIRRHVEDARGELSRFSTGVNAGAESATASEESPVRIRNSNNWKCKPRSRLSASSSFRLE